ncbi:hypothetical protein M758_UG311000 [Ceratodon purpureus]|nr:hypothetical protein M758_UG311000 [Ceratodon purpureus]
MTKKIVVRNEGASSEAVPEEGGMQRTEGLFSIPPWFAEDEIEKREYFHNRETRQRKHIKAIRNHTSNVHCGEKTGAEEQALEGWRGYSVNLYVD